jgi:hypothetical protein
LLVVPLFAPSMLALSAGCASSSPASVDDAGAPHDTYDTGSSPDSSEAAQPDVARTPLVHRATATPCSRDRPVGTCYPPHGGCQSDAECTEGRNGRCMNGGIGENYCSYDACVSDGDCAAGTACVCREGRWDTNTICGASSCRVDADCEGGFTCSPSRGQCGFVGNVGYFCHTAEDTCVDDADCPNDGGPATQTYCMWNGKRWGCYTSNCAI